MCVSITTSSLLLAVNFWFFSNSYLVSGVKPHCVGPPLKPDEFSQEDDVGLVRDLVIDVIARNLYNLLNYQDYQVSNLCSDLANMRTSTCLPKCSKWNRSSFWNKFAKKRVMTHAEALVEYFNTVLSEEASLKSIDDEKIMIDFIQDVRSRLVKSGAANEGSKIIGELDNMKNSFCKKYLLDQSQKQEAEQKEIEKLSGNDDVLTTIKQFIQSFETQNEVKISNHRLEVNVVKAGDNFCSGIIRLRIEYKKNMNMQSNSVILKIPSLGVVPYEVLKKTKMFAREVYFYTKILPELYQLGSCKPFAPILYTATQTGALVMEDLTVEGYKPGDRLKLLNIDEAMETLNVVAIFHALGYKYLQTLTEDDPSISMTGPDPVLLAMKSRAKKPTFDNFCEMLKPHLSQSLYDKILMLENEILADPVAEESSQNNSPIVIMHDDLRPNNILFKYNDKGIAVQAKLLDWSGSKAGSPVLDLIYMFVTAIRVEDFEANDHKLLTNYLDKLNAKLKSIKSNFIYRSEDLDRDFTHYKYFYLSVLILPWQKIMLGGKSGEGKDVYISSAIKWLNYLERKKLI